MRYSTSTQVFPYFKTILKYVFLLAFIILTVPSTQASAQAQIPTTAVDDLMYLTYKTTDTINILGNDTLGTDYRYYDIVVNPSLGTLVANQNGEITYTPNSGSYGYDQFAYALMDVNGRELSRAFVDVTVLSPITSQEYIDLYVYKTDADVSSAPGETITYTLVYENLGTIDGQNAFITEILPPYTTFVAGSSTGTWNCVLSVCTYEIGDLSPNSPAQVIYFSYMVDDDIPETETEVLNTAFIGVRNDFAPNDPLFGDTNPSSNTSTDTTPIVFPDVIEEEEEIVEEEQEEETEEEGDVLGASTDNGTAVTPDSSSGEVLGAATLADTGFNVVQLLTILSGAIIVSIVGIYTIVKPKFHIS